VWGSEELDKSADDTSLDDFFNRRVSLFGQQFSELGRGLDLEVDLVREDAGYHLRKILVQLERRYQYQI
jgi:hypothetical protein